MANWERLAAIRESAAAGDGRSLLTALGEARVSDAVAIYLTQLVAANTGVDQATAGQRVDNAIA